jgi:hypothetical protein
VQAKLAAQAVERRCRLRGSPVLLTGRLFDNRGNRMSPTHANKCGARYRYYVSQAVLQKQPQAPGLVSRVPATEIEALVVAALRNHLNASGAGQQLPDSDRDLVECHVELVTLTPNHIELRLRQSVETAQAHDTANHSSGPPIASVTTIAVPWTRPVPAAVKGIIHVPAHNTPIKPGRREAFLIVIAKARKWIDDLAHGRAASFAAIARREGKVERHIRLLAPLAFVSPRIVSALLDGTAPADLTPLPDDGPQHDRHGISDGSKNAAVVIQILDGSFFTAMERSSLSLSRCSSVKWLRSSCSITLAGFTPVDSGGSQVMTTRRGLLSPLASSISSTLFNIVFWAEGFPLAAERNRLRSAA